MSEEYATKVMSASATYANITMTALMQKSNSIIAPPYGEYMQASIRSIGSRNGSITGSCIRIGVRRSLQTSSGVWAM